MERDTKAESLTVIEGSVAEPRKTAIATTEAKGF